MKATVLFWVHGIGALLFGLGFLIMPAMMVDMMEMSTDTMGLIGWRFFGLGILGTGGIVWGSRNKLVRDVKFPIMLVVFLVFIAMTVLQVVLALVGTITLNFSAWGVIAFHVVMAVWYGYFLFTKEKAPASQAQPAA